MVIRPKDVREVADAVTIARGMGRRLRVGAEPESANAGVADAVLDLGSLKRVGPIDLKSRLVEVELGIRADALVSELALRGFTAGEPVGPGELPLHEYVARMPERWHSPRAMTLRARVVAVRGIFADGTEFATLDAPRSASGPLFDHLIIGGVPDLVPAVLTHATLRIEPLSAWGDGWRAFRGPVAAMETTVRSIWPRTVEIVGLDDTADVVVFGEQPLPGFTEVDGISRCFFPVFRRTRWSDFAAIPRPFWAYGVDAWGVNVCFAGKATESIFPESLSSIASATAPDFLASLDPTGVLRSQHKRSDPC